MKLIKLFILLVILGLLNLSASAQTWKLDKSHASLTFSISHYVASTVDGTFTEFDASIISSKPDFSDAKVSFTAKASSVNTANNNRDEHLREADFFDVAKFPLITFKSTSIKPTGNGHFAVTGDLTLHGITKPVTMDLWFRGTVVNPSNKAQSASFSVTGTVKRPDFDFGKDYGTATLGNEVSLKASGLFEK